MSENGYQNALVYHMCSFKRAWSKDIPQFDTNQMTDGPLTRTVLCGRLEWWLLASRRSFRLSFGSQLEVQRVLRPLAERRSLCRNLSRSRKFRLFLRGFHVSCDWCGAAELVHDRTFTLFTHALVYVMVFVWPRSSDFGHCIQDACDVASPHFGPLLSQSSGGVVETTWMVKLHKPKFPDVWQI